MTRIFIFLMILISLNCYAFHYDNSYSQGFNQGYGFNQNSGINGPAPPHVPSLPIPGQNPYVQGVLEGQRAKNLADEKHPGRIMDQATAQRLATKLKSLWGRKR